MTTITLSNGLIEIENGVFNGCRYLKTVVLPQGVKTIGRYVFTGCDYFEDLYVPDSVIEINDYAFNNGYIDLTVHVKKNSYAEKYCKSHQLRYKYY